MEQVLASFAGVSVFTYSLLMVLAFLWSGFVFYKKGLEANEPEDLILDLVMLMGAVGLLGSRLFYVLMRLDIFAGRWIRVLMLKQYPGLSGWGLILGVVVSLYLLVRKTKKDYFEWLDMASLGLVAGMPIAYVVLGGLSNGTDLIFGWLSIEWIKAVLLAIWFAYLWWVEGEYRTFEWYRGGRTQARAGFITGMLMMGWGTIELLFDLSTGLGEMPSYILSSLVLVGGGVLVYIRSGRNIKSDWRDVNRTTKKLINKFKKNGN